MLLEKAKEIIELNLKEGSAKMPPDCRASLWLAIHAFDRIITNRTHQNPGAWLLLPGETMP